LSQWELHLGYRDRFSMREVIARAVGNWRPGHDTRQTELGFGAEAETVAGIPDLREVLLIVAGVRGDINSRRLGRWLGSVAGRIVGGRRIVKAGLNEGLQLWQLEKVD
jgi:hypothetical protein